MNAKWLNNALVTNTTSAARRARADAEVAAIVGIPCATVKTRMFYARGQILAFHMLILGIAVTGMTFEIADRTRRRAMKIETVRPSSPRVLISVAP